jgi:hypothetical protein
LTGEAEYSVKSLQEDLENLLIQISRQTIPKRIKNRHFTGITKKGKYQKYK